MENKNLSLHELKVQLNEHKEIKASTENIGHIKVDGSLLNVTEQGLLEIIVENSYKHSKHSVSLGSNSYVGFRDLKEIEKIEGNVITLLKEDLTITIGLNIPIFVDDKTLTLVEITSIDGDNLITNYVGSLNSTQKYIVIPKDLADKSPSGFSSGERSIVSNSYATAHGFNTIASGEASYAEGFETKAIGEWSHAEGFETKANGVASHAEGENTTASGRGSHAEGRGSIASGNWSHAEGIRN